VASDRKEESVDKHSAEHSDPSYHCVDGSDVSMRAWFDVTGRDVTWMCWSSDGREIWRIVAADDTHNTSAQQHVLLRHTKGGVTEVLSA